MDDVLTYVCMDTFEHSPEISGLTCTCTSVVVNDLSSASWQCNPPTDTAVCQPSKFVKNRKFANCGKNNTALELIFDSSRF